MTNKGRKSWVLFYRVQAGPQKGRQRRYTLGQFPMLSLAEARASAQTALRGVELGADPAGAKQDAKSAPLPRVHTVEAITQEFIERYAKRNRSWPETQRIFRKYVVPTWGERPIESITRPDVIALLDGVVAQGAPVQANRVLAAVRKLFNWCVERSLVPSNPAASVSAPTKEVQRERVLSDQELQALWQAGDALGYPFGPMLRFLMVTGQRRDEVASMVWAHVDLEKALWTIPREITKADRAHEVPLSPLAVEILNGLPRLGQTVFSSGRVGDKRFSGFSKAKARADSISDVSDWRLHDLRRTVGTGMASLGVPVSTISRVLNHAEGGVTKIYNRYGYASEKRVALEKWADHISVVSGL